MSDATLPDTRTQHDPTTFGFKTWKSVAFRLKDRIGEEQLGLIAAGVAFYAFLALFPAIAALVAVWGLFADGAAISNQAEGMLALMPDAVRTIILGQITEITSAPSEGLGWAAILGLILAFYSASKGMANLMAGLNIVFEEDEKRGFFRQKFVSLGLTLAALMAVLLAVSVAAILPAVLTFIADTPVLQTLAEILRWPVLMFIAIVSFAVIYRFGPSRDDARWAWVAPGSIMACLLWVLATAAFTVYVSNFGTYNETFGTLGGVVILLTWLWISAFIVLLGALLDAEIEASSRRDTTTGPDEPRGERGATKADEYVAPDS